MSSSCMEAASVVAPEVDFRTLAAEHIARGFVVSATKPGSKEGIPGWNTYNVLHTIEDVDRFLMGMDVRVHRAAGL